MAKRGRKAITEMPTWYEKLMPYAENLGTEYVKSLEDLGAVELDKLIMTVRSKYQQTDVGMSSRMSSSDWVIAVWRYVTNMRDDYNDLQREKLMQWAFIYCWQRDRMTEELQQQLTSLPDAGREREDLKAFDEGVEGTAKGIKALIDAITLNLDGGIWQENLNDKLKPEFDSLAKSWAEICNLLTEHLRISETLSKYAIRLMNKYTRSKGSGLNEKIIGTLDKSIKQVTDTIENMEDELGLKFIKEEKTFQREFEMLMEKVDRFRQANPKYYTWVCPECGWEGQLCKSRPADGTLSNSLSHWWVWVCPQCNQVIALDQKHPLYIRHPQGYAAIPFSHNAWQIVEGANPSWGRLTVLGLAHILESSWEWIVYVVRDLMKQGLPEHVVKEVEAIESGKLEVEDEDNLPVSGPDEVSLGEDGDGTGA